MENRDEETEKETYDEEEADMGEKGDMNQKGPTGLRGLSYQMLQSQGLRSLGSTFTPSVPEASLPSKYFHLQPSSSPNTSPNPRGTLLLLGIIHANLKDGGPLAAQKGHSWGCTVYAPL